MPFKKTDPIPTDYQLDYLIFQLCDGDASKKEYYERNFTYAQAILWNLFKKYDGYVQAKQWEQDK